MCTRITISTGAILVKLLQEICFTKIGTGFQIIFYFFLIFSILSKDNFLTPKIIDYNVNKISSNFMKVEPLMLAVLKRT